MSAADQGENPFEDLERAAEEEFRRLMEQRVVLLTEDMAQRHPGLSEAVAAGLSEAAQVCLARHHQPPTTFRLEHDHGIIEAVVEWEFPSERTRRAWANQSVTTEHGASALVLAAVEAVFGLVAISRAESLSGADYLLVPMDSDYGDFDAAVRLEISGVDSGPVRRVYERVRRKITQVARGTGRYPALVGVVGFDSRRIVLETVGVAE
ncbi:MAG TPA: hypothetical protein VFJ16_05405 [Longimicrobium sp.]|nr:hypothetical protein [Longimicrobium sp.]